MKKFTLTAVLIFCTCLIFAQSPQAFKYQAVARDNNGDLLANQNVSFRVSILQGSPQGSAVYMETHSTVTNDYGLACLEIGRGTIVSGVFNAIDWGAESHFLQVEMDETGGTNYQLMGASELLSVPYSLYAGASPPDDDWQTDGSNVYNETVNVGIGTSTPGQKLSVIGRIRAANAADETEYAELWHGGGNAFLNWAGDGNLDFRYASTTLATLSQGNHRFYVSRPDGDYGPDKSSLFGYRYGGLYPENGGISWAQDGMDAAVKGFSFLGNNYSAGIAGYNNLNYPQSAAVIGGKSDGTIKGFLGYKDDNNKVWAGYFDGDLNVNGNVNLEGDLKVNGIIEGDGSGLTNLPSTSYWTVSGNNIYSAVSGNVGIGTSTPGQKLSVVGRIRAANATNESEYLEMWHGGGNAFLNWSGNVNFDIKHASSTLATVSAGDTTLYIARPIMDHGPGKTNLFAYRSGNPINYNGGVSWCPAFIDAAIIGYSYYGNTYTAGIAGYNNLDHPRSTAVVGAKANSAVMGFLAYKDENNEEWAGYFIGDVKVTGTIEGDGSGLTNIPGDDDWLLTGNDMYSSVSGNVGIGTSTPGQKLAVIGRIRAANAADETEYAEIWHGGNHAFLNWSGDGNFDIRYNTTTLATVSPGDTTFYVSRENNDYGAGKSSFYAYRHGSSTNINGGTAWTLSGIDAAVKGYSYYGNYYTAGIAGYSRLNFANSAAVMGAKHDATVKGYLAYKDGVGKEWAGFFDGDMKVTGVITGDGSGLTNLPIDETWILSGNNIYSAVSGNVGIGTIIPETDLSVYSNTDYQGLTLQTSDNSFNQGLRFRNSGGAYTWHMFRKDAGSNNADLVFASGASTDITTLSSKVTFKYNGKVGIGTTTPAQQLSVVGPVRSANSTGETNYTEILHDGSNAGLNWSGSGNFEIRYNNNSLATISNGNNRFYVSRPTGDYGANKSCIYALRSGGTQAANGGTSWAVTGVDAAVKGYSEYGNNYSAGVAGYSFMNYAGSAGVVGAQSSGGPRGCLGYYDGSMAWAGYFEGYVKINGNTAITGNLGIGTASPVRPLSVVGSIRGASDATETKYLEFSHGGSNAYFNWSGGGNLDFRYSNSTLATLEQSGNLSVTGGLNISGALYVATMPLGDKKNVQWDDVTGQFYYDNSSRRYKENISTIDDDFSRLLNVTPKTYTRPGNPGVWEIGYIAEEFDEAGLDKLVWYDETGQPEGINYDKIVLYTNENVKAQNERIKELEEKVKILEQALEKLQK